jgi:hypothetical protein
MSIRSIAVLFQAGLFTEIEGKTRVDLLRILGEIDNERELMLASDVTSFFEHKSSLSAESLRRRGGHPACECPDTPGDSLSTSCLSRRLSLVQDDTKALNFLNSTTGISIEGGRIQLRKDYGALQQASKGLSTETESLVANLTGPSRGYVVRVDSASKVLLNEETLMVQSANNAWAHMINVSGLVDESSERLSRKISNSTESLISWFNQMQKSEEHSTVDNLKKTLELATSALEKFIDNINAAKESVYGALGGLESTVGESSTSVDSLEDSLKSASNTLAEELDNFNLSLPSIGDLTEQRVRQSVSDWIREYQSVANQQISLLHAGASTKLAKARNATSLEISGQAGSMSRSLSVAGNQSEAGVETVGNQQAAFLVQLKSLFNALSSKFEAREKGYTSDVSSEASSLRSTVSRVSDSVQELSGQLGSFNRTEKTSVSSSNRNRMSYLTAANTKVTEFASQASAKAKQVQGSSQSISSDSVEAVGSRTQSKLASMGSETNSMISTLADAAGSVAQASAQSMSQLSRTTANADTVIGSAKATVVDQLTSSYSDLLSTTGNIPKNIEKTLGTKRVLNSALSDLQDKVSLVIDQVTGTAASTASMVAGNHSQTERQVSVFAANMTRDGEVSRKKVRHVTSSLKNSRASKIKTAASVAKVARTNSLAVSKTATQVASSEEKASGVLKKQVDRIVENSKKRQPAASTRIAPRLSKSLTAASNQLESAKKSLDVSASSVELRKKNAVAALEGVKLVTTSTAQKSWRGFQTNLDKIRKQQNDSLASVDGIVSSGFIQAAGVVQKSLKEVAREKKESEIAFNRVSLGKMDSVRVNAERIDSLSTQVQEFLKENVGPLSSQKQDLIPMISRLVSNLKTIESQADKIESRTATKTAEDSDWPSGLSRILIAANSSALDRLLEIGSGFNRSAVKLKGTVVSEIVALESQLTNNAKSLETQLSKLLAQAASAKENLVTGSTMNRIANISSAIITTSKTSHAGLNKMKGAASSSFNYSALYSNVIKASQAASRNTKKARAEVDLLAAKAANLTTGITAFNQTNGFLSPADVKQQAGLASITENVAASKLEAQQASLNSMSAASTNLSSDFHKQLLAQTAALNANSSTLFNQVAVNKARVSQAVGRIAAQYTAQNSQISTNTTVSKTQQARDLVSMRSRLLSLLQAFRLYTGATNASSSLRLNDMNSFAVERLGYLNDSLGRFGQDLIAASRNISVKINTINSTLIALGNTQVDSSRESLADTFNDWVSTRHSDLLAASISAQSMGKVIPVTSATIRRTLSTVINSFATTARSILRQFKINNPKLDAIILSSAKNMTSSPR